MASITTQDNPWSGVDIYHYIDCETCKGTWRVDGRRLVSRAEDNEFNAARSNHYAVIKKMDALTGPLVDAYFDQFAAPSMAAEHREMQRLGITSSDVRSFRKGRNAGKRPSELGDARRNMPWIRQLLKEAGLEGDFDSLQEELDAAIERENEAAQKVQYVSIPNLWGAFSQG